VKMTRTEFERQFGEAKPNHEYWFGEAIPKAMHTIPHGVLQKLVMVALDQAGYRSASEVTLKISSDFQPVPDVMATAGRFERPYPTKPVDVVIEILSPEDSFHLDSENREGWVWDRLSQSLKPATTIDLPNGRSISLEQTFQELDGALQ